MAQKPPRPQESMLRQRYVAIGLAIIILVILGVVFWFINRTPADDVAVTNQSTTTNVEIVNSTVATNESTTPSNEPDVAAPLEPVQLAQFFAERYGSYTSASNFANIQNLKPYMTQQMQRSADAFVASQGTSTAGSYTEIVTKVLSTDIQSLAEASGTIRVTTQRTKSGDAFAENDVYYEDLLMNLVKDGDIWKVASAAWTPTELAGQGDDTPPDSDVTADDFMQ